MSTVHRSGNTFIADPPIANGMTTIDGYLFFGLPYYDPDESKPSAVGIWLKLYSDPNYEPLPPVTSVSVDTTVSGTVDPAPDNSQGEPDPEEDRSDWGRTF